MTRHRQRFLCESIYRVLIRTAAAATALVVGYVVAPAHTIPVGPIQRAMLHTETSAGTTQAQNDSASAGAGLYVKVVAETKVEAETMCSDLTPYEETESALPSVTGGTIHSLQFEMNDLVKSGTTRGDVVRGREGLTIAVSKSDEAPTAQPGDDPSFRWESAIRQSALFLAISHAFRFATEPSTRADFKGPFWRDYFQSVKHLRGWGDGDEFLVNYIGHPMEGAVAGFIQIHNDPKGIRQEVGFNRGYWASRLKALGWAAAFSTQYEIGLVSEASLGNVGLKPGEKSNHPMGYVDLVVTPVVGTAWLVGEDLLDRYVIQRVERKVKNRLVRALVRSILNPSRSFANMHRSQWFWHRDDRPLKAGF